MQTPYAPRLSELQRSSVECRSSCEFLRGNFGHGRSFGLIVLCIPGTAAQTERQAAINLNGGLPCHGRTPMCGPPTLRQGVPAAIAFNKTTPPRRGSENPKRD